MLYLILKRFLICILALSLSIGMLTGCSFRIPDSKFEKGYFYQQFTTQIRQPMVIKSNTDTFSIDNVEFELFYGIFDADDTYSKRDFFDSINDVTIFALYICEFDENGRIKSDEIDVSNPIKDHTNIPQYTLIYSYEAKKEMIFEEYSYSTKKTEHLFSITVNL